LENTVVSPLAQQIQTDIAKEADASAKASTSAEYPSSLLYIKEAVPTDQLVQGDLFAWFQLERELETGITAPLWLARDYSPKLHSKQAALKFLPDIIAKDTNATEELKDQIRRRIVLRHPNISRFYDLVNDKGRLAVHMEYVEGQSLSHLRLASPNQVFEVRTLEKLVIQLCSALDYAHQNLGAINAEISPDNLFVDAAGNLKLKGIGMENYLANAVSRLMVQPGEKPQPGRGPDPKITDDLYSLGATIYELLTGQPPFENGNAQGREKTPVSMIRRRAELGIKGEAIPNSWEEVVAACLAKDPGARPQSAIQVAKRLERISEGKSPSRSVAKRPFSASTLGRALLWMAGITLILAPVLTMALFCFPKASISKPGRIVLDTIPTNADVVLDGVSRGATPLVIENIALGEHQMKIEREGCETQMLVITVDKYNQEYVRLIHLVRLEKRSVPRAVELSASESIEKESRPVLAFDFDISRPASGEPHPAMFVKASSTSSFGAASTPSSDGKPTSVVEPSTKSSVNPTTSSEAGTAPSQQLAATANPGLSPDFTSTNHSGLEQIKEEVTKRINLLPGATAGRKAALIEKMRKARSMERLTIVRFDRGQTVLRSLAADELVKAFNGPDIRDKLSDPTTVLVVAGYADPDGNVDMNLRFSRERARSVSKILREQLGLSNAIQAIGMGGTELLDSARPDQNRAVEVWAVVPL
jgi:serine/threonine protein kinase